jgi:hypothetical protein
LARQARVRADLIEGISLAYGGSRSKDSARVMQEFISALRKG